MIVVRGMYPHERADAPTTKTMVSVHLHKMAAKRKDAARCLLNKLFSGVIDYEIAAIGSVFDMEACGALERDLHTARACPTPTESCAAGQAKHDA